MFFVTPDRKEPVDQLSSTVPVPPGEVPNGKRKRLSHDQAEDHNITSNYYRKRTAKACDRCRLKKAKCTGGKICEKCRQDGVICATTKVSKKGDYSKHPDYTQMVETQRDQLAQALHTVLQARESVDPVRLRNLLSDIGISAALTPQLEDLSDRTSPSSQNGNEAAQNTLHWWDEVFDNLNGSQLELIESFYAGDPQFQAFGTAPGVTTDNHNPQGRGFSSQNESGPNDCDLFFGLSHTMSHHPSSSQPIAHDGSDVMVLPRQNNLVVNPDSTAKDY